MSSTPAQTKSGGISSSSTPSDSKTPTGFSAAPGTGPSIAPNNQAHLLSRLGRTSTPDSEALDSSDDEPDAQAAPDSKPPPSNFAIGPLNSTASVPAPITKPTRRMSWLTETSSSIHTLPRKNSFAGPLTMSPTGSNPNTPGVDSTWGALPASAGIPRVGSLPWSSEIWNSTSTTTAADRRESISRRGEHLTSPNSVAPLTATSSTFFADPTSVSQASPATNVAAQSQFPFSIPLHPTPKTYRSQSYSVGQLDSDTLTGIASAGVIGGRTRPPHSGIPHRASRPSMLGDLSEGGLGKLKEDDDEEDIDPIQRMPQTAVPFYQSAEAKQIEKLERENAMLRQQQQQYQNAAARVRPRTTSAFGQSSAFRPDDSDYAIDELDETYDSVELAKKTPMGRRLSEYTLPTNYPRSGFQIDRKAEVTKTRAYWQTAPGFAGDVAQSRRHSFAEISTRQTSITTLNEAAVTASAAHHAVTMEQSVVGINEVKPMADFGGYGYDATSAGMLKSIDNRISQSLSLTASTASRGGVNPTYFGNSGLVSSPQQQQLPQGVFPNQYNALQQMHAQFPGRTTSPHHNNYPISQPRHNQLLHVVLFKCARADVFYIQEGTGLEVKPGDLVIVEADRGTDLGTVAKINVDWQAAKDLKEHYAEEHYKWLMMYSQNAKAAQDGAAGIPGPSMVQSGTVGGMGPPGPHHMQEPVSTELKPKLIKRLAQAHEVTSLREKEGNEAKAKRVCMQKVKEHGLNMEILDAEFQMDWKKLTFYYFADNYINFNSLVTDLFKIYKTRIWMSAINPASFASPTLSLQAPSGIGPGAVGVSRSAVSTERRPSQVNHQQPHQFQHQQQQHHGHLPPHQQHGQHHMQHNQHQQRHMQQTNYPGMQGMPGYNNNNGAGDGGVGPAGVHMSMAPSPFNSYGNAPRGVPSPYSGVNPNGSPSASGTWNQGGSMGGQPAMNNGGQQGNNAEWMQHAMQGLSLNSR